MALAEAVNFFEATLAASAAESAPDRYLRTYHAKFWFVGDSGTTLVRELHSQSYSAILHSHGVAQQSFPALRAKFRRLGTNWGRNPNFGAPPAPPLRSLVPPPAGEAPADIADIDAEIASLTERLAHAVNLRNDVRRSSTN